MPIIELGRRPELCRVQLYGGQPFFTEIKLVDDGDAYDVAPVLVFPLADGTEIRWPAELQSSILARFEATAVQVDDLITAWSDREAHVEYDGLVWYAGKFEVLND